MPVDAAAARALESRYRCGTSYGGRCVMQLCRPPCSKLPVCQFPPASAPEAGSFGHETVTTVDARFRHAIELFNEREFFACHDVLEELWNETLGPEREFYQGLIHAAVALFHFDGGNLGGARKMYGSALRFLAPYRPQYSGVDLDQFVCRLQACFRELAEPRDSYPAGLRLDDNLIPTIALTGDEMTE